jgi:YidC/Oxa1 family membrane protein insertase
MRHAPFVGWIQDLSAPDPSQILNLFGLIPWDPGAIPFIGIVLGIGIWPLFMGITMWLQMQMNPKPQDEIQQMVFAWMPVLFTIMLSTFSAGLVIYWAWNNFLSIVQQYVIMKRMGVEPEWKNNIKIPDWLKSVFPSQKKTGLEEVGTESAEPKAQSALSKDADKGDA